MFPSGRWGRPCWSWRSSCRRCFTASSPASPLQVRVSLWHLAVLSYMWTFYISLLLLSCFHSEERERPADREAQQRWVCHQLCHHISTSAQFRYFFLEFEGLLDAVCKYNIKTELLLFWGSTVQLLLMADEDVSLLHLFFYLFFCFYLQWWRLVILDTSLLQTTGTISFIVSKTKPVCSITLNQSSHWLPPHLVFFPLLRLQSTVFGPVHGTQGAVSVPGQPCGQSNRGVSGLPRPPGPLRQLGPGVVPWGTPGLLLLGGRVGRTAGGTRSRLRGHRKKGMLGNWVLLFS